MFLILFLNYIFRAFKSEALPIGIYNIGLAGFFLCNAVNFVLRFIDFYYPASIHTELLLYSRIVILIGATTLIASFELSKILKTKGYLTLTFVITSVISNLVAPISIIFVFISSIMHIIASAVFFYIAIREKSIIRYQAFITGLGIIMILFGSTIRPSDLRTQFPNIVQLLEQNLTVPIEIFPYILIYFGIVFILAFEVNFIIQLQWMHQIRSIYLITPSGTSILEKNFIDEHIPQKESLTKNVIVENILNELKMKKNIEKLNYEGLNILLGYGKQTIGIILTNEPLQIISKKLKAFIKDFEQLFQNILLKWDKTNVEIFKPAYVLINRYFTPSSS